MSEDVKWTADDQGFATEVGGAYILVRPHNKGGYDWEVLSNLPGAPLGHDEDLKSAMFNSEFHARLWISERDDVLEGRKPIPDDWLEEHDETAEIVAAAVAQERAAVVSHLRERAIHGAGNTIAVEVACTILADLFERGEHRREEEP